VDEVLDEPKEVLKLAHRQINRGGIGTLLETDLCTEEELECPHTVKAAANPSGRCFWFSRGALRGSRPHVGIYAFSPSVLSAVSARRSTPLSAAESLEQLSWLEIGYAIWGDPSSGGIQINTQTDYDLLCKVVKE